MYCLPPPVPSLVDLLCFTSCYFLPVFFTLTPHFFSISLSSAHHLVYQPPPSLTLYSTFSDASPLAIYLYSTTVHELFPYCVYLFLPMIHSNDSFFPGPLPITHRSMTFWVLTFSFLDVFSWLISRVYGMYLGNSSYPNGINRILPGREHSELTVIRINVRRGGGEILDCASVQDCRKEKDKSLRLFDE